MSDLHVAEQVIRESETETLKNAYEFLKTLENLRSKEKLYDTYIQGIKSAVEYNGEFKVYYNFKFDGTATGRLSCAAYTCGRNKKKGISFHTLPRTKEPNIRSLFVPPPGWYFITSDYSQMELRILAHLSKELNMIQAFIDNKDLHLYTASLVYRKPENQITKEERQVAKAISFLLVYGGSKYRLSKETGMDLDEAEELIEGYFRGYPRVRLWMEDVKQFLYKNKYVVSMFGFRRNLPNVRSPSGKIRARAERQACNFIVQKSASDITCFAVLDIMMALEDAKMESRVVATVHDSIEVVSPRDELLDALSLIRHRMIELPYLKSCVDLKLSVPLSSEHEVGRSFGEGVEVHFNKNYGVINTNEVLESLN